MSERSLRTFEGEISALLCSRCGILGCANKHGDFKNCRFLHFCHPFAHFAPIRVPRYFHALLSTSVLMRWCRVVTSDLGSPLLPRQRTKQRFTHLPTLPSPHGLLPLLGFYPTSHFYAAAPILTEESRCNVRNGESYVLATQGLFAYLQMRSK